MLIIYILPSIQQKFTVQVYEVGPRRRVAQLGLLSGARSWTRRRRSGKCGLLKGGGVRTCRDEERLELSGWSLEAEVGRQDLEQLHRQEERGGLKGDLARIIRFAR